MIRKIFLLFFISITITAGQDIATPSPDQKMFRKDYTYDSATEMFYKAHKIPLKFQDAVNTCKFEGSELAVPKTEGEAKILSEMFRPGVSAIYVGLHDIYAEGEFMTLDGVSIDEVYSKWAPGEPNNVSENEDCVLMGQNKEYNDVPCVDKFNFICSKPESSVHYNFLCETYDSEYFYNIEGDRCYKLHTTPRSWHEAFKICKAEEAALVKVNSETEAKFLVDTFNSRHPKDSLKGNFYKDALHVDFTDLLTPGVFLTSDGKTLESIGYDIFENGQPNNYQGNEHCGNMFRTGKLNDVGCDVKCMFYCEKILGAPQSISLLERAGYNGTTV